MSGDPRQAIVQATTHCVYCPTLCLHACPVHTAEPSDVVAPWGKMSLARWLATGRVTPSAETVEPLYKCTGCGACQDACRHHVDVSHTLAMARALAVRDGASPYNEATFAPPGFGDDDAILPDGVSGYRLLAAGYVGAFTASAKAAAARLRRRHEVVFASAADARCVREAWPQFGIELTVSVLCASERPGARPDGLADGPVAYFEACNVARGGHADMVRSNAQAAAGDRRFVELRWRGETATCCGAGGAYGPTSPEGAARAAERILDNALLHGAKTLLVGCAGCSAHLAAARGGRTIEVRSIGTGQ